MDKQTTWYFVFITVAMSFFCTIGYYHLSAGLAKWNGWLAMGLGGAMATLIALFYAFCIVAAAKK